MQQFNQGQDKLHNASVLNAYACEYSPVGSPESHSHLFLCWKFSLHPMVLAHFDMMDCDKHHIATGKVCQRLYDEIIIVVIKQFECRIKAFGTRQAGLHTELEKLLPKIASVAIVG
ncbi:hypothetical protein FN846DRAFT_895572 [Sphaerosporella brunnea]|uniref:Uncharacterized protein n=1 Tax=Sphaerosporella brunnea TaxID=1250544 RepID=A0A5J5EGI0_9PEZI|nr:hypothetical protein FN846DRAFT_895572 [Sphaerosporella brunnea]